jgi:hypothetical protein
MKYRFMPVDVMIMSASSKPTSFSMHRVVRTVMLICILMLLPIAIYLWVTEPKPNDGSPINFKRFYPPLAAKIKQADKVLLYEGLPHQESQKELLETELKTKSTIQLHGFPFYTETLPLSAEDARALTTLFCDGTTLKPDAAFVAMNYQTQLPDGMIISIGRLCGGYHPDYCIEWEVEGKKYRMQVCLGCAMVRCFGPGIVLYADIDYKNKSPLWPILIKYRKNRPGWKSE